ncbi:hypothetical protein OCQ_33040 [Mycobacterium paraintracellulare]|nr:hypothetical protein OCQ_33040 [Mycobacterium paraintracellulare]
MSVRRFAVAACATSTRILGTPDLKEQDLPFQHSGRWGRNA